MSTEQTVTIYSRNAVQGENLAAAGISPGHLIERTSANKVQVHATAGGFSMPMFAIEAFQRLLTSTDVLMVGGFLGTATSGVYFIASQVSTLIAFGIIAVNVILPAMISELHVKGRRQAVRKAIELGILDTQ